MGWSPPCGTTLRACGTACGAEKIACPDPSYDETAHLFAFLYTARYVDERGDEFKGSKLFESKGCARCHALRGVPARLEGAVGPDLSSVVGLDTPVRWTQAMWNHASSMQENTERLHLAWPRFEGREMNDLLAYIRANSARPRTESELLPASPERGWKVFQSKSCIECHAVHGKGGRVGPELGPGSEFPPSIVQFAQTMWIIRRTCGASCKCDPSHGLCSKVRRSPTWLRFFPACATSSPPVPHR
jgi:cytochrome c2